MRYPLWRWRTCLLVALACGAAVHGCVLYENKRDRQFVMELLGPHASLNTKIIEFRREGWGFDGPEMAWKLSITGNFLPEKAALADNADLQFAADSVCNILKVNLPRSYFRAVYREDFNRKGCRPIAVYYLVTVDPGVVYVEAFKM